MSTLLLLGAALAAGVHTGVPLAQTGLQDLSFLGLDQGWSAGIAGGYARGYVGPTEDAARTWTEGMLRTMTVGVPPLAGYHDAAWGDGDRVLLVREGNVGLFVRVQTGARAVADGLLGGLVVQPSPWPVAPNLKQDGATWVLEVPVGASVSATGGTLARGAGWRWTTLPREIVVWDAYGRGVPVQTR